jgi:hypothetical protein
MTDQPLGRLERVDLSISVSKGTGGVREIKALREMSPAAFSVSIETGSTFFRFQLGLIYRLFDRPMNAARHSAG